MQASPEEPALARAGLYVAQLKPTSFTGIPTLHAHTHARTHARTWRSRPSIRHASSTLNRLVSAVSPRPAARLATLHRFISALTLYLQARAL